MDSEKKTFNLKITLELHWKQGNEYDAKISVRITDSCFHPGPLQQGPPPGTTGLPETQFLAFNFTHDEGKACSDLVKTIDKTISVSSAGKTKVTAFAVVNGSLAGSDTKDFPR